MPITNLIRDNWCRFQGELFSEIQDAVGPLLKNHQRFVMALGIICPEDFTLRISQRDGRPLCDRINLVRAFIAKAIWDIPTTRDLVERLKVDRQMRNLCGWVLIHEIPSESTFSRAFAEFAESNLPGRMHEALVKEFIGDSIVGHVSRDSTAIPAREKPTSKCKSDQKPMKRKRGRPRKGEERPPKDKSSVFESHASCQSQNAFGYKPLIIKLKFLSPDVVILIYSVGSIAKHAIHEQS